MLRIRDLVQVREGVQEPQDARLGGVVVVDGVELLVEVAGLVRNPKGEERLKQASGHVGQRVVRLQRRRVGLLGLLLQTLEEVVVLGLVALEQGI
ncbi:hypothetical protein D3C86_1882590 [compost metagenome]